MKSILGLWFGLMAGICSGYGQETPPRIEWQQSFGGSYEDILTGLLQTADHGYVLWGYSYSGVDGNKTSTNWGSFMTCDAWVIRLDAQGNKVWEKSFGGSDNDYLYAGQELADHSFIFGGTSFSDTNGNKTSPAFGGGDIWLFRLDADGNKTWEQTYGGSGEDGLRSLQQLSDGGFILGGYSVSPADGSKTSPCYGAYDFWVVRLDAAGNQLWDASFGGTNLDMAYKVVPTSDGGFLAGGQSQSDPDGNKTSPSFSQGAYNRTDYWVVRLDANGYKLWEASFGGTNHDRLQDLVVAPDGGSYLGGSSRSDVSGNKTTPLFRYNAYDCWLVRLDADGNKLWEKAFGGTLGSYCNSLALTTDGGLVLAGLSAGTGGNKTSPGFGNYDYWLVRLDADGNKLWDQSYGGNGGEGATAIPLLEKVLPTHDGGFLIGGSSASGISGNKTSPNWGGYDFWVVKVSDAVQPRVALSPSGLTNAVAQGRRATNQSFQVWNGADGILFYTVSLDVPWATITPTNGFSATETNLHTVQFQSESLPAGTNHGTITLSPLEGGAPLATLDLTLIVEPPPPPRMRVVRTRQSFSPWRLGFQVYLSGQTNSVYVTEYSSDLANWFPLQTNRLTSPELLITNEVNASTQRFYRARTGP